MHVSDLSDFPRLVKFLIGCIELEMLNGLELRRDHLGQKYIAPWQEGEPLFVPNAAKVSVTPGTEQERQFLEKLTSTPDETSRVHYGFPCFFSNKGFVSPLFFVDVDVRQQKGNFELFPIWRSLGVNRILLQKVCGDLDSEEVDVHVRALEGRFGSFGARMDAALEKMDLNEPFSISKPLEPLPSQSSGFGRWCNTPILFEGIVSGAKAALRFELTQFLQNDYLLNKVPDTALGVLFGCSSPTPDRVNIPRIEISPMNAEQAEAVNRAMSAPLSIVTGPPGTGKSQVVANILANCVVSGQSVLFACNNNKPLEEVHERLSKVMGETGDWSLRLGNDTHRSNTKTEMLPKLSGQIISGLNSTEQDIWDQIEALKLERQGYEDERAAIQKAQSYIEAAYEFEQRTTSVLPKTWVEEVDPLTCSFIDGATIRRLSIDIKMLVGRAQPSLLFRLRRVLFGERMRAKMEERLRALYTVLPQSIQNLAFADPHGCEAEALFQALQWLEHHMKWHSYMEGRFLAQNTLQNSRAIAEIEVDLVPLDNKLIDAGRDVLRVSWAGKLKPQASKVKDALGKYFDHVERLKDKGKSRNFYDGFEKSVTGVQSGLPVWLMTCLSVGNCLPRTPALFDCVVIDEASQSDFASILPLLFRARRAVLVGDPKQLPHIAGINLEQEAEVARRAKTDDLVVEFSPVRRSAYDVGASALSRQGGGEVLLSQHYRCHPEIIGFSNATFYGGRLIPRTSALLSTEHMDFGVYWHHVDGVLAKTQKSAINAAEASAVLERIAAWVSMPKNAPDRPRTIGVVTPFRAQADLIKKMLQGMPWFQENENIIVVGTAHAFQGGERDVMVFSPVVTQGLRPYLRDFVAQSDPLLNVAATRAQRALHVVGDRTCCLEAGGSLAALVHYVDKTKGVGGYVGPRVPSAAERVFRDLLVDLNIAFEEEYEVFRQSNVMPYRLDFMVISNSGKRYDLEVDGSYHLENDRFQEDMVRDEFVKSKGFEVLRFPARDVFQKPDVVRARLMRLV